MGVNPRGAAGEDFAAKTLADQGYGIVARNVHSRYGEVDIVAVKDGYICFVEVKARKAGSMVPGTMAVGRPKQRKIIMTAMLFLQEHPEYDLQPRFDVFSIETGLSGVLRYDYLTGAFDGEAYTE